MKIALITGISGQDGSYLAELLLEKNYKIYGIVRRNSFLFNSARLEHIRDHLNLLYGDMTDCAGLSNTIHKIINENSNFSIFEIYNLAAQSHVQVSFEIPKYTTEVDGLGVCNLLEAIRVLPKYTTDKIRIYQAGTSEMYGHVLETPQTETTPFNPCSPYAAAKVYAYNMMKIYREGYGLFASNGILFNHESPRRGAHFVTQKIIKGVLDINYGKNKDGFIRLGNLYSKRDWGHTKDYVYGMWLILQHDKPDDFVLATGETHTVKSFVEKAFLFKGLLIHWVGEGINEKGIDQDGKTRIVIDPKYYRPCEVELLLGNPSKATRILNWNRKFKTLNNLIKDMFSGK
jgi:GDPmannose 4,6-dehydratase